jgi:TolB-like protein
MGEESPKPASTPTGAVFLSYASQDAEAAQRICAALRSAGVEVWFDQSELRGGDVWDRQISKQIRECALFIAVISAHTDARSEGYFRREWRVAVDRTRDIADDEPFLLPVVIDGTPDATARVPDKFREVQWTRLLSGETSPAFVGRVSRLLSQERHASRVASEPRRLSTLLAPGFKEPAWKAGAFWRSKRVPWLIVAAVVIAVGYFWADTFVRSKRVAGGGGTSLLAARSVAQSKVPDKSIAVLPFVDLSEKKDQEYFSDGLSEELIDLLTKVPDLRVPARTSSFYFKGQHVTIADIAKALSVAHLLEGSVRKAGNTIRVTAQLVRADNGYHLWSETYDREVKDVFKVQDEIAGAVVSTLKLKLAPRQQATNSHRPSNPEAYNQYLLGRKFYDRSNLDGYRRSVEAYRKAIELDPRYAAAYAELAISEFYVANLSGDLAGKQQALATADKAVMLAPDEADGYAARGILRPDVSLDWTGAQADIERALAYDPGNSTVQRRYGVLLADLGRLQEAIAATKKATASDPLSSSAWSNLSYHLLLDHQFAAAHEAVRRALEIEPESVYALTNLGKLQLLQGEAAEALTTFRQIGDGGFRLSGIAMAEHILGYAKDSQQSLDALIAKDAQHGAYQAAEVYAWRGEKDKAFDWLERAYREHLGGVFQIKVDPLLASLRDDPRFVAMLRKMQLPE